MTIVSSLNNTLNIKRPDGAKKLPFSGEVKSPEGDQTFGADVDEISLDQPNEDKVEISKNSKKAKNKADQDEPSKLLSEEMKAEIDKEVDKILNEKKSSNKPKQESAESSKENNNEPSESMAATQRTKETILGYASGVIKSSIIGAVAGGVTFAVSLAHRALKGKKTKPAKWWGLGVGAAALGLSMANTVLKVSAKRVEINHNWDVDAHDN